MKKACVPSHAGGIGASCTLDDECAPGAICSSSRTCSATGSSAEGDPCIADGVCKSGLRCVITGLSASCAREGSGDVGATCATSADCLGGLACSSGVCKSLADGVSTFGWDDWTGETCVADPGPVTAYFRVPRGKGSDGDFYRLPFPNDARKKKTHPDLTGHPTPGNGLLGFDPVDAWLRAIEAETDGFGAYPTVLFRTSGAVDRNSFRGANVVSFVDVTKGAPEMGQERGLVWYAGTSRGKYICDNWFGVRPAEGQPLTPGHTYAVLLTKSATADDGSALRSDDDFDAMLADAPPTDPALAAAYVAYAPLRAYLDLKSIAASTLLDAAVFTVASLRDPMTKLAAAVTAMDAPKVSGWVRCGDASDPCADPTGDRACGMPDPSFDELHAVVSLPIFQTGQAPYRTPADGGGIDVSGATVLPVRTEAVCLSLTVPRTTAMPAAGWPVVIYAGETDGNYRSSVSDTVAALLAAATPQPMAVLTIDQVLQGPRSGPMAASSDELFNLENPASTLGNGLQGAADQLSLARLAATLKIDSAASPTGSAVAIDPAGVAFWGHSFGAALGGVAAPYSSEIVGAVLSGAGGSFIHRLLTTTSPNNVAALLPVALEDMDPSSPYDLMGREFHPVLSLLQSYLDPADPLHHAALMTDAPPSGVGPHHLLQAYGIGDTHCSAVIQSTYAVAGQLALVAPDPTVVSPDDLPNLTTVSGPLKGNKKSADGKSTFTSAVREYQPSGYDGHFVAFQNPAARTDISRFLSQVGAQQVPQVGP